MSDNNHFDIHWIDGHREPQCDSNPAYPRGVDLDGTNGYLPACLVQLPYPAKRCGQYALRCQLCGMSLLITTAGRLDDPRSVKIPCIVTVPNAQV